MSVRELRVALTVEDYDEALAFYRDALGLPQLEAWESDDGRVTILDAGRATLELLDAAHAAEGAPRTRGRELRGARRAARRGGRGAAGRPGRDAVAAPQRPAGGAGRDAADAVHGV